MRILTSNPRYINSMNSDICWVCWEFAKLHLIFVCLKLEKGRTEEFDLRKSEDKRVGRGSPALFLHRVTKSDLKTRVGELSKDRK
jgi:hypothetical protein